MRWTQLWILGALLSGAWLLPRLEARDIFVDNAAGNDRLPGDQPRTIERQGPVRTIARALELAELGDRIILANTGQPYHEMIGLSAARHCGLAGHPFVIDGQGAVLDGSRPVPAGAWKPMHRQTYSFQPARLGYQQLFLDGVPAPRRHIDPNEVELPELQPREWAVWQGLIVFTVEAGKIPADYALTYAALPVGITLDHVHDIAVTNLTVQGFQLDGINAHDGVRQVRLIDVVSRGNGRSGVAVVGTSRLRLEGCLLGDNGTAQLYTEGFSRTTLYESDLLENSAPALVREGGLVEVEELIDP